MLLLRSIPPSAPGLLENVYEACLAHEVAQRHPRVRRQVSLPVAYGGIRVDTGLRPDPLVERHVVVELKAVEMLLRIHRAQPLTCLKLSGCRLGLPINCTTVLTRDGIKTTVPDSAAPLGRARLLPSSGGRGSYRAREGEAPAEPGSAGASPSQSPGRRMIAHGH